MLKTRSTCRACGSNKLVPVLSLGEQCIASNFSMSDQFPTINRRIALELVRCAPEVDENACGLTQLRHTVSPGLMYASYGYRSGINQTMTNHLQTLAHRLEAGSDLKAGDVVVDIGSNDGTLLRGYKTSDARYIGFEPSNVLPSGPIKNLTLVRDYFSRDHVKALELDGRARIITTIAMFYDLDDPNEFVAAIQSMLAPDGVWVLEMSYLAAMLERTLFDSICHEHLTYYCLFTLERLLDRHGLQVIDVEVNEVNGGSFRSFIVHRGIMRTIPEEARSRLYRLRAHEFELELDHEKPYQLFADQVYRNRSVLREMLNRLRSQGSKIYGYGASTKGNVILQFCDLGPSVIEAIADRNPAKWGSRTIGTNIPIVSEEEMRDAKPDYLLVLPWHFLSEFKSRESEFLARGGKFILPVPKPSIAV